jgi:hypothetical protein
MHSGLTFAQTGNRRAMAAIARTILPLMLVALTTPVSAAVTSSTDLAKFDRIEFTAQSSGEQGAVQGLESMQSLEDEKPPEPKVEPPKEPSTGGTRLELDLDLDLEDPEESDDEPASDAKPVDEADVSKPVVEPERPAKPVVTEPETATAAPTEPATKPVSKAAAPDATLTPVAPATPSTKTPTDPTQPESNIWLFVVIGVVLVLVIGGIVFALGRKKSIAQAGATQVGPAAPSPKPAPTPAQASSGPVGRPTAVLRDLTGTTGQTDHVLTMDVIQIGRAAAEDEANVQSVVVQKKTVGRRHAVIEYRNHTYWLVDQGSLNGSYVNGARVNGEVALRPGARIRLESAEFEFNLPGLQNAEGTAMGDSDEFAATMMAPPEAGVIVVPGSTADTGVDETDTTAPAGPEEIEAAKAAATLDFDVFGSTDEEPERDNIPKRRAGGLIDRYIDD